MQSKVPADLRLGACLALQSKVVPEMNLFEDTTVVLIDPVHGGLPDNVLPRSVNNNCQSMWFKNTSFSSQKKDNNAEG